MIPSLIFMVISIFMLLLTVTGVICTLISKRLALRWKLLTILLILDFFYLAWMYDYSEKHSLIMPTYFFHDGGDWVTAEGTWLSDTKLADASQTTQLSCRKNDGYCHEVIAAIRRGFLSLYDTYWEIENWAPEKITFKENNSAICVSYNYFIDLKNETVTSIRTTKTPKLEGCEDIMNEPIHMHLGNPPR